MNPTLTLLTALLLASLVNLNGADVTGSLPRSLPAIEGVDPSGITQFLETMEARRFELHSFMLLRHGKVVAETWWAPYAPEVPHGLCGIKLETDGIPFKPTVPKGMSPVAVYELPYRQAELEIHITGEGNVLKKLTINGKEAAKIPANAKGKQVVEIQMGS